MSVFRIVLLRFIHKYFVSVAVKAVKFTDNIQNMDKRNLKKSVQPI